MKLSAKAKKLLKQYPFPTMAYFTCNTVKSACALNKVFEEMKAKGLVTYDNLGTAMYGPLTPDQLQCLEGRGVTVALDGKGPLWFFSSNCWPMLECRPHKDLPLSREWQKALNAALAS